MPLVPDDLWHINKEVPQCLMTYGMLMHINIIEEVPQCLHIGSNHQTSDIYADAYKNFPPKPNVCTRSYNFFQFLPRSSDFSRVFDRESVTAIMKQYSIYTHTIPTHLKLLYLSFSGYENMVRNDVSFKLNKLKVDYPSHHQREVKHLVNQISKSCNLRFRKVNHSFHWKCDPFTQNKIRVGNIKICN